MDLTENDDDDYSPTGGEGDEFSESDDDEGTLEEEENLHQDDDNDEISALQQEQDLPLEDLMRLYGYCNNDVQSATSTSSKNNQADVAVVELDHQGAGASASSSSSKHPSAEDVGNYFLANEDSDADDDYVPRESWKKEIRIGSEYQAEVSDGLTKYCTSAAAAADNGVCSSTGEYDDLIWDPDSLKDDHVIEYLTNFYRIDNNASPPKSDDVIQIPDDETALKLLYENRYDQRRALAKCQRKFLAKEKSTILQSWTDDDVDAFENGLKQYGKNFYAIQKNVLNQKSVADLVRYYYFWKKTERHDEFLRVFHFEKRPFHFHANSMDYADHFLNSLAGGSNSGVVDHVTLPELSVSTSQNSSSLMSNDNKVNNNNQSPIADNGRSDISNVRCSPRRIGSPSNSRASVDNLPTMFDAGGVECRSNKNPVSVEADEELPNCDL